MEETRWTIAELGDQVSRALAQDYEGPPNERIRAVPNTRTIRYYTTLGILDRPLEMQGRTALYGRRHLLQLVAIKRLQADGASLADIQGRLSNLSDRQLAAIAQLDAPSKSERRVSQRAGDSFWQSPPAEVAQSPDTKESVWALQQPRQLSRIALAPGVELLVETARAAEVSDAAAVREAAAPLLAVLKSRGLFPGSQS